MNAKRLLDLYDRVADAPDAIAGLRRFVLNLAVRGKLVPQDPADEPATKLLAQARKELKAQAETAKRMRWKQTDPVSADEIDKDVPSGWMAARVNDTGLYINGLAFKPAGWKQSGIPIIRIQNLTDPVKEFNYAEGDFPDEVMVRQGDLLVSWSATLDAFKWDRGECVLNQHIFRVIPHEGLTDRDFLLLLLRHAIREMADSEHAHGLVMTHINRGPFLNHVVLIPPLAEQRRIVAKVDELMALLDRLETARTAREATRDRLTAASLARLTAPDTEPADFSTHARFALDALPALTARSDQIKQLHQTILKLAVRGKLVEQDPADEPALEIINRLHSSGSQRKKARSSPQQEPSDTLFDCPKGWVWTRVQQILDPDRSISYGVIKLGPEPKSGGIPTLRCSDVRPGYIDLSGVRNVEESIEADYARTRLEGGEIVINIRGTLGGVALVPGVLRGHNVAREVAVIPIASELSGPFLVYLMLSPYFWDHIQNNLRGIAYKGLNLGILRDLPIPVPPLAEQHRIVAKVDALMALCDRLEAALATTDTTRQRLLGSLLHEALTPAKEQEAAA